jgi:NAD(P)-dependent dehydrogenase (short-subunit alcohol dehydrogenase family)
MGEGKIAIVTGANRGLGFEICRQLGRNQFEVLLTSRNVMKGRQACELLQKENLNVHFLELDVSSQASIEKFAVIVTKDYGRADVLINNAGIMPDRNVGIVNISAAVVRDTFETNVMGPLILIQSILPLMYKNNYGRIVNMSSELGSLNQMGAGYPAYRISKTGLNALTRIFAGELHGTNILVNSMSPGWVKTDMGGAGAPRTVEEGADTAVWLAMLPDESPSGGFYRDRVPIEW